MPARPAILVADPREDCRSRAQRVWGKTFDVVTVSLGREALYELRRSLPFVVFAEWSLLDITGTALEIEMRNDAKLRGVPLIFSGGWKERDDLVFQFLAFRCSEVLKEAEFAAFIAGLSSMCDGGRPAANARAVRSETEERGGATREAPATGARKTRRSKPK